MSEHKITSATVQLGKAGWVQLTVSVDWDTMDDRTRKWVSSLLQLMAERLALQAAEIAWKVPEVSAGACGDRYALHVCALINGHTGNHESSEGRKW